LRVNRREAWPWCRKRLWHRPTITDQDCYDGLNRAGRKRTGDNAKGGAARRNYRLSARLK
jgi:hypothetical protein